MQNKRIIYHTNLRGRSCKQKKDSDRNVFRETKQCWSHGDCPRHLRCTNGWCGDPSYHQALARRPCEDDSVCEVRFICPEELSKRFRESFHNIRRRPQFGPSPS